MLLSDCGKSSNFALGNLLGNHEPALQTLIVSFVRTRALGNLLGNHEPALQTLIVSFVRTRALGNLHRQT